jgi:cytochrome c1
MIRRRDLLCAAALCLASGCGQRDAELAETLTGGSVRRGRDALDRYGCGSCHEIPGVAGARGLAGPSLARLGLRSYLAGRLQNRPEQLTRWIQRPQQVDPGNAMPDLSVTDADARDMAAYLYTLR